MDPGNETLGPTPIQSGQPAQRQWETAAREWLLSLPDGGKAVTVSNVEAWVSLNRTSLPDHIISMASEELYKHFTSLRDDTSSIEPSPTPQALVSTQQKDDSHIILKPYQFQRTDLWRPVYTWLESLDTDELINSQDILDWLTANPEIREQLSVKHSRYHLMHYIKKCHIKMLKRKEKKKGVKLFASPIPKKHQKTDARKQTMPLSPKTEATTQTFQLPNYYAGTTSNTVPKDADLYALKRNEAVRKYQLLVELEKQLSVLFPKPQSVD